jgi:hypothetical protein
LSFSSHWGIGQYQSVALTLEIGDRKPSQFLRQLRTLLPDVPDDFLRTIWSSRLPSNIQAILAFHPEDSTALPQGIEDPSRQVASLTTEQNRPRTFFKNPLVSSRDPCPNNPHRISRNRRPGSRPPSRGNIDPNPCAYRRQGQPTQQASPAAQVCTTSRGRLFITDRITKRQFLVDTGSDLCVYPRRLIPRRMERVDYDLCAADGSTIHTYGWLPLSLNLGLRRDFTWRFLVADVTHPIIGADFLAHFWWTAEITASWMESRRCPPLPKQPAHRSQA